MKTYSLDQVASTVLKYLLHFLFCACFYFVLLYTFASPWLHQLMNEYAHVAYVSNANSQQQIYFQLGIYTLFCYFINAFVFDLYHRNRARQLMFSVIADLLIIPLGILIMVIYNNIVIKHLTTMDSSLYNIYVISVLIVIKEFITGVILARKKTRAKNRIVR